MVGSCGSWSVFRVFINIALAGWNLRFTSLAAATRRCPTLSKAIRFLRYVALPSNVTREYSDIRASLYRFLLSGAGQYVFCSHSTKFEDENWENREEHTETILTSWHEMIWNMSLEITWKLHLDSFGFRCLHYERVQSWKACLQEGLKMLKMGRNRFSDSFSRHSADTFFGADHFRERNFRWKCWSLRKSTFISFFERRWFSWFDQAGWLRWLQEMKLNISTRHSAQSLGDSDAPQEGPPSSVTVLIYYWDSRPMAQEKSPKSNSTESTYLQTLQISIVIYTN